MKEGNPGDAVVGCGLLAFCFYFWMKARDLPVGMDEIPGPALFPQIILIGLFVTALWLLARNLRLRLRRLVAELWQIRLSLLTVAGLFAAVATYAWSLTFVPFAPATFVFVIAAAVIALRFNANLRSLVHIALMSLASAVLIELVFLYGLGIRL